MLISLSENGLLEYIIKQLNNFFPDKEINLTDDIKKVLKYHCQEQNIVLVLLKIQLTIKMEL